MRYNFHVGQIITGTKDSSDDYCVTNEHGEYKILSIKNSC